MSDQYPFGRQIYQPSLRVLSKPDHLLNPYKPNELKMIYQLWKARGLMGNFKTPEALFKKVNNKPFIATCLTNLGDIYQQKRDLDRALDYKKQSLTIYEELENKIYLSSVLESLVAVLLDKRDYEQAQLYLDNLKKINEEEENKEINLRYQFSRALFLKSSPRLRDRGRAEERPSHSVADGAQINRIWDRGSQFICDAGPPCLGEAWLRRLLYCVP